MLFGAVVLIFASAHAISGFYVEALWFQSVGQSNVFWDVLKTKTLLAVAFTVGFTVLAYASLSIAERLAPIMRTDGPEEQVLQRYRELVGRRQGLMWFGVSLLFGLIAGVPASARWQDWTLFRNATNFGQRDQQFNTDIGFYVFRLPFLTYLVTWLFAAFLVVTLLTAVAHYLNGGIRLQPGGRRVTSHVKLHLSALAAMLAVLKAADYWLQRYELTTSQRGYVDGATFTDIKAQLPALKLLLLISLLAAVLLIVNVWQRGWRLPVIAVGLWAVVASIAGTAYPAFVQRFQVEPSESTREAPYIKRNIDATRAAFQLDRVEVVPYAPGAVTTADVASSATAFDDVRLLDPTIVGPTFKVLQGLRAGYNITDVDVDRYTIDGRLQQVALAARQLDVNGAPLKTWEGRHLAYTHGYGLAVAPASTVDAEGRPLFVDPATATGELQLTTPQLYIGDGLDGYAVVGTDRSGGEESLDGKNIPYTGSGGVTLSSKLRRAAFALSFGEYNLFGSKLVTGNSRIIYHRDVRDRVSKVAPFLSFDSDPYPVAINGKVVWVLDAYTTTNRYPYSERADTRQLAGGSGLRHSFNYVRNPVKAVVDAYDGTVTLYVVDPKDPIIDVWAHAFPKLFTSATKIPAELAAHFRYPEDLFRVQTNVYGRYHLDDAQAFYSQQLAWSVAQEAPQLQQTAATANTAAATGATVVDPGRATDSNSRRFNPYYVLFHAPDPATGVPSKDSDPSFVLLRPFVPFSQNDGRKELQAFMTASSDPATYGKLTAYVLQSQPLPDGPLTVASALSQQFSRELTLIDQTGARVRFGDLQIVPTGKGILYVRPWFSEAESNPVPALTKVSVTYRNRSAIGGSVSEALNNLFPDLNANVGGGEPSSNGNNPSTSGGAKTPESLLAEADVLFRQAQEAKAGFDSKTYQQKIEQAYELVRQAAELATGGTISIIPGGTNVPTTDPLDPAPPTTISA